MHAVVITSRRRRRHYCIIVMHNNVTTTGPSAVSVSSCGCASGRGSRDYFAGQVGEGGRTGPRGTLSASDQKSWSASRRKPEFTQRLAGGTRCT